MINTIAVSVYVGVAVICGAIFAIYGYKKGWKGGLSILSVSLVSALCSFYAAPVVAGTVGDLSFVTDLADSACSAAEEIGIGKQQLSSVVEKSIDRVLEIPAAILLFVLFFIILAIVAFIVRKILGCGKEQGDTKSKIIGLSLAAVSIPLVLLFTVFAGKINILEETKRADTIIELVSKPEEQLLEEILYNSKTYTDMYFDTTIIEADDATRLAFINSGINGAVSSIGDKLLTELYDFEGYSTRDAFNNDLSAIAELYTFGEENELFGQDDIAQKIFEAEDKETLVNTVYSLSFRDVLLRYILTSAIRGFLSDDSYVYPAEISFDGTQAELIELIETVQMMNDGEMSKVDAAKALVGFSLIPNDVVNAVIKDNISNVLGDEMADKVLQYIDKNDILDKIADGEVSAEDVTEFFDKIQSGEIKEDVRIDEIEDFIKDNEIIDKIEQGDIGGADDKLIEDIRNGNFSDISIEDIMTNFGI